MMRFSECFDKVYVVNLPERKDRREHILREFERVDLPRSNLIFYPAIRPLSAEGFPSVGARGCFLSHLSVLKDALAGDGETFLVLEDDASFPPQFQQTEVALADAVRRSEWDMMYFGHRGVRLQQDDGSMCRVYEGPIETTVAYGIKRRTMPRLVAYLEAVLTRTPGHPSGGPMHVDGAFSMFRAANPGISTAVCIPQAIDQASFGSDISPGWIDRTPGLSGMGRLVRGFRRNLKQLSA